VRDRKGPGTIFPQGSSHSDLLSPARLHFLKFPASPKIALLTGD
jgi:hypothetical protein